MHRIIFLAGIVALFLYTPIYAQVSGCTDPAANNFNPLATQNNGSCTYNNVALTPALKSNLALELQENSGLIYWNNHIWTHNDGGNTTELFEIDTLGNILRRVNIQNAVNVDWEDITQDDNYVYVGDFGNNASGNRQDLTIYRVAKADLLAGNTVTASVIQFSYANQTDFTAVPANTTDFDCEAMIQYNGNLYLFTKRWTSLGTSVYEIPATPGSWSARLVTTSTAPAGLVTGADISAPQRSIILCGYTSSGARFLYFIYDFTGTDFFGGNERYVTMNNIGQTEGIAFKNPEYVFVSRERLTRVVLGFPITITQALEAVNLTTLLQPYYQLLPIEWIQLSVRSSSDARQLKWEVMPASEFKKGWIQRRDGTMSYQLIAPLPAAKGSWEDREPDALIRKVYYRVMAMDKDERVSFSREVMAQAPTGKTDIVISPSVLRVHSTERTSGWVKIYDLKGAQLISEAYVSQKEIAIDWLPRGLYTVIVTGQDGLLRHRQRFMR